MSYSPCRSMGNKRITKGKVYVMTTEGKGTELMTRSKDKAEMNGVSSRIAEAAGVHINYVSAGQGPALILLHGYTQTSLMWTRIIPVLAKRFTVIAPDLPGIGDSEIPKDGLDIKNAAIRIRALAATLGIQSARVVGH